MTLDRSAAGLLRSIGLLADGPARWAAPVAARGPGIYVVEVGAAQAGAPIDLAAVGRWIERVPAMRLDGDPPTGKALAARLASFWLPDARVLYAGSTEHSVGPRVSSLARHLLGDRRPHPDGHWLHALRAVDGLRIWWALTAAPEESLDALLDAFAAAHAEAFLGRPAGALLLPWATTRRPTGERQLHGITASLVPDEISPPAPGTRVRHVAPGDAEGATVAARGTGTVRRTARPSPSTGLLRSRPTPVPRRPATPTRPTSARGGTSAKPMPEPISEEALGRMRGELDDLMRVRRPDVVARIKAARELGDLRENSEYHAAREEQSFLEGRVRQLEERLRNAVVLKSTAEARSRVGIGSIVTLEHGGETIVYTIVGTTEADPAAGRISTASPVGRALLGARPGDEIDVRTPGGTKRYRVDSIA